MAKKIKAAVPAGKKEKKKETKPEFISGMAVVLVVGLFIITFTLQAFEIPSASMENTLLIGDHLFVDRVTAAPRTKWMPLIPYRAVRRGDIVVFLSPAEPGLHVVKRVIGVPGDRIRLEEGTLYLNGERQEEPYVQRDGSFYSYRDNFPNVPASAAYNVTSEWRLQMPSYVKNGELVVPPGRYFAMGDNRDASYDGRFWGFIPEENIIGRPKFIYWSFESDADAYQKRGLGDRLANILNVAVHFFSRTRWSRMLDLVS